MFEFTSSRVSTLFALPFGAIPAGLFVALMGVSGDASRLEATNLGDPDRGTAIVATEYVVVTPSAVFASNAEGERLAEIDGDASGQISAVDAMAEPRM